MQGRSSQALERPLDYRSGLAARARSLAQQFQVLLIPCHVATSRLTGGEAGSRRRTINAMLYGRGGEQAAIERLLQSARAGVGGALVLRGEPGIGKSALLGLAAAAGGFSVLRAAGVEAESGLAYATLHQLLHPMLDGGGRLPAAHADPLRAASPPRDAHGPGRFRAAVPG